MSIEKKIRQSILTELKKVNKQNAPIIHRIIENENGYKRIEKEIIDRVIDDKLPPSAIIPHIENELCL